MTAQHHGGATAARRRHLMRSLAAVASAFALVTTQAAPALASPAQLQNREWWIGRLGLEQAWQITKGSGVTVAVVDDGVDAADGDLRGVLVPGFTVAGASGSPTSDHSPIGHGTSMAIHIAGRGTDPGILGVAPQAKIMPIYLPDSSDNTADVLKRLNAAARPPQIVNMSYGTDGTCPADLQAEVKTAVDKGMILVASAGNNGSTSNLSQYPSNCAGVVAVGAFDNDGNAWTDTQRQPYVCLGGPGVDIVTYNRAHTIGTSNGTSDAAAIVSGELALLRAKFPSTPSRQLVARMFATASKSLYHGPGYGKAGDTLGFGPALVHQALIKNVPASAPNPVYDALARIKSTPPATARQSQPAATGSRRPTGNVGVDFPGADKSNSSSGGGSGAVIGIIVAIVVVIALVIGLLLYRRRRAVHTGSGPRVPPGAGGGP